MMLIPVASMENHLLECDVVNAAVEWGRFETGDWPDMSPVELEAWRLASAKTFRDAVDALIAARAAASPTKE